MIKYLGLIPARKGSKGIPNKNLVLLAGKPLIQHTIESALQSNLINTIHLTSDSNEIMDFAKSHNIDAPYKRPIEISSDTSSAIDVIVYHINWVKENLGQSIENIVYLQPTSPIRSKKLIDNSIIEFERLKSKSLVAICECSQHPYETVMLKDNKMWTLPRDKEYIRRQDYPASYFISGGLYIFNCAFFLKNKKLIDQNTNYIITSKEEGIDIDDYLDLKIAETIINTISKE
jgi:CMP-N,N'-diacetyllegionaminic acid synthase